MLILNLLQISVLISLAISIPILNTVLARFNEARSRALAQRANSARLHADLHEKNRAKREIYEDFDERCHDDEGEEDLDLYLKNARHHHQHVHQHIHQTVVPPPPPPPAVFHGTHHSFVHPPPIHHHQTIINQHQFADQFPGGGAINQAQAIHTIRKNADEDTSGQVFDPFDQRHEILQFLREYEDYADDPHRLRSVDPRYFNEEFTFRSNEPFDDHLQSLFIFRPQFYRNKRSLPLSRLITDPNIKLDIPKTMENFGTVTKHALEDEHASMYHMRNLIGSSKNTLLSAMRIPPQQLIIPSQYRIVKHDEELKNSNNNNGIDPQFDETFQRVGKMMRETIRSGQDTIEHLNDMAHDARNVIYTSRHALPKLIIPYAQTPAVQCARKPPPAVLITPRIFDVAEKPLGSSPYQSSDFVRLGHIMDAIGLSRPDRNKIAYQKIEFKPKTKSSILQATNPNLPKLLQRLTDNNLESVSETVNALKDAKISVGAKNLRDFLLRMRDELTNIVQPPQKSVVVKYEQIKPKKLTKHKKIEDKEIMRFVENLFNDIRILPKNDTIVGLRLPPELEHPFMGRASKTDLKKFLESYNDQEQDEILQEFAHYLEHKDEISANQREQSNILGAINPLMFERMYNESLKLEHKATESPKGIVDKPIEAASNVDKKVVGASMTDPMLKPLMERLPEKKVQDFLDNFNAEQISDEIDQD